MSATQSQQKPAAPAKPAEPDASSGRQQRSPNYPSMLFMDALERVKKVYALEKKHPVRTEIALKHMGWTLNGRSRMYLASMKHYGLLIADGTDSVRVSDRAAEIIVLPEGEPRRAEALRQLAMQPRAFQQVIAKYGTSLPSDASLSAYLQLDMGFTPDACPVFIAALKHALEIAGVDGSVKFEENGGLDSSQEATMMPTASAVTMPLPATHLPTAAARGLAPIAHNPTADGSSEQHKWKLAEGVWAEITITGTLDQKGFEKLKKYVALIDVSEAAAAQGNDTKKES